MAADRRKRSWIRSLSLAAVAVSVIAGAVTFSPGLEPQPAAAGASSGVPAGAGLPTVQTDGIVWSVAIVGNTVYAGGRFGHARPAGTASGDPAEVVRHNILAFDLATGALLPFAPDIEGQTFSSAGAPDAFCRTVAASTYDCDAVFRIKASPDGSKLFVAGDFATVDGKSRQRIAAFSTATGALDTTFKPALNGRVRALAVTASTAYAGGDFTTVNSTTTRGRLAAFDYKGVPTSWAPTADKSVWSMSVAPALNRVVIGGNFNTINTTSVHGLMAVDATSGASVPWAARAVHATSVVTDIVNDGSAAYLGAYNFAGLDIARFEGRMAVELATGVVRWIDGCYGDTQAVTVMNGVVYSASHSHDCHLLNSFPQQSKYQRVLADTTAVGGTFLGAGTALVPSGAPLPKVVQFMPDLDGGPSTSTWKNGPWSLDSNGSYLVAGGEFLTVNGKAQQSLVRFAVPSAGGKGLAPAAPPVPSAAVQADGSVRVTFTETYDRDSPSVRYDLVRSDKGSAAPVATATRPSGRFWSLRSQTLVDRTLPAGQSVQYRVRVIDPDGNAVSTTAAAPVTGKAVPALGRYAKLVLADDPAGYWRLGDATTSRPWDTAGSDDLTAWGGVTAGAAGAVTDAGDKAMTFNGTSAGTAFTTTSRSAPDAVSLETWFKTTSTSSAGELMGFGSAAGGDSNPAASDRVLYLDTTGKVSFGVNTGTRTTISSTATYRDGQWHHVVGSVGPAGLQLYLDGALVASKSSVTWAQYLTAGYWRLGGDTLSGWAAAPASGYFAGSLDEAAVYPYQLTSAQVHGHFAGRAA